MTSVSVIVVSYNTRELLRACLTSVIAELAADGSPQSPLGDHEIGVVDNASTDGSADMVRAEFPSVRLIANGTNRGFAAANNQALAQAKGEYLLLLNPDTVVEPGAIQALAAFLDASPQVGMVTGRLRGGDGSFQHSAFHFPGLGQIFFDFFPLHHRLLDSHLNGRYPRSAYRRPFAIDHPLGACMMVRREAFEAVGGLSEEFFIYCEEIDWCLRLKAAGWQAYCVPEASVVHYGAQSTRQVWGPMFVELHRSRLLLYRKHYSRAFRWAAHWLVRLGLCAERRRARRAFARGDIDAAMLRQRLEAYHGVAELWRA